MFNYFRKQIVMRFLTALVLLLMFATVICSAQPSDEQIRKDLTNSGTKKITFTKTTGTRQWNKDIGNWEWVRGVKIVRSSQFAGIDLEVEGDAVYQYTGPNKYSYWKFRTLSNNYVGLPNPTPEEIRTLISTNWQKFFGYNYNNITTITKQPELDANPEWNWDDPSKVNFTMTVSYEFITSNTEVSKAEHKRVVRFFRNDVKSPWRDFLIYSETDPTITETKNVGEATVRQLRKKTLAFTEREQLAQQAASSLPQVDVPEFSSVMELTKFVHNTLRNGTAEQFRAVMIKLLAPQFFEQGSKTQLTAFAEQTLNDVIKVAYKGAVTYKQEYCKTLNPTSLTEGNTVYFSSCIKNTVSEIAAGEYNVGYKEGVPQKALRIFRIEIRVRDDQDAMDFLNSFSNPSKLCPND